MAVDPEPPAPIMHIAQDVRVEGGRLLLVGGFVRDRLLGIPTKDVDVEIHGLELDAVERLLARHGEVIAVGRAFGVFRLRGLDADFALPRRDSKVGAGHRGFDVAVDPHLGIVEAARRRDLTINSMAFDPLDGELLDAHGGQRDLQRGVLRATDPVHFIEDPLRGLRVAQLAARFEFTPDAELIALCATLDLAELPAERQYGEFRKLLLRGRRPALGLRFLERSGLVRHYPELAALLGVPQEPEWHPEGDVWVHTCMVVDVAAGLRDGGADDEALMFGALCHDLGKPATTERDASGRLRSFEHSEVGVPLTASFLGRLRAPEQLVTRVCALVLDHLAPGLLFRGDASLRAYRRLARRLGVAGVSMALLERVARADHLGRTTADALEGRYAAGDHLLRIARDLEIEHAAPADAVLGRHLIARGLVPGPRFGKILERCREVQDDLGIADPERILDVVLGDA